MAENNTQRMAPSTSAARDDPTNGLEKDESFWKTFNDPVHGYIALHPVCVKIVDTLQFQRLRNIKQLGGGYFVYPGASHNRFEHSIGVCHLAGKLIRTLEKRHVNLIDDEDVLCVEIAGLCHDMGHGPFSHVFDSMVIPRITTDRQQWKHEDASLAMFDHMIMQNEGLQREMFKYKLLGKEKLETQVDVNSEKHLNFIKNLIKPPSPIDRKLNDGRGDNKTFLYTIVSNKNSEVDVDKWDYFARDYLHLGLRSSFDHNRFIQSARVCPDKDGKMQLCVRDKEVFNVYQMFQTRHALHKKACKHRVTSAVEYMLTDILAEAKDVSLIPGKRQPGGRPQKRKIEECIGDMDAYTNLTDDILHRILLSNKESLQKSQELIKALYSRNLYAFVLQTSPFTLERAPEILLKSEKDLTELFAREARIPEERIIVQVVILDFGKKKKNPVDEHFFYTKDEPNRAITISQTEVSYMVAKEIFQERLIRIYLKQAWRESTLHHDDGERERLKTAFKKLCPELAPREDN